MEVANEHEFCHQNAVTVRHCSVHHHNFAVFRGFVAFLKTDEVMLIGLMSELEEGGVIERLLGDLSWRLHDDSRVQNQEGSELQDEILGGSRCGWR